MAVTRRRQWSKETKEAILERQNRRRRSCNDELVDVEIDHIVPLRRGGSNNLQNLQALCDECHNDKTQKEEMGSHRSHTLQSQLSIGMWKTLHKCPKPKEVSWGEYTSTQQLERMLLPKRVSEKKMNAIKARFKSTQKVRATMWTKHIKDSLLKKAKAQIVQTKIKPLFPGGSTLHALDAKGCRMNALLHRDRPLPIFSPLDEPTETFDKACLSTADFIYVDAGQERNIPYSGCSWYAAEVVQYMLNIQIITLSNCKSSLTASRHISTKELAFCFETIQQCWETASYEKWGSKEQAERNAKEIII